MLPALREELALHPGPAAPDGSPSWTLHDPVRNSFFRIGWSGFEIIARWDAGSVAAICARIRNETTLAIEDDDVLAVLAFLTSNQLVCARSADDTARLAAMAASVQRSWFQWLLHNYLFIRIPLLRPDRLLDRMRGVAAIFYTRGFLYATGAALACGLMLISRQWDVFRATLVDTLTPQGLLYYGISLTCVKTMHEFAHACTAKRFGCRVPTMGVALLVLWPVLYTDVNDSWRLARRDQRLAIGAAGILAELTLAAWSSLAWGLLPDGPARQMAFVLAAITWISSLAINLSPFMRFDGYFLLMDALDIPNLHQRAFAMARWRLRETLFALGEDTPEDCPAARRRFLVLFAFVVWAYRLAVFLGIAVLVYHFFIKAVGIMLFCVEIAWFVVLPITRELAAWWTRRAAILARSRVRWPLAAAFLLLLLILLPWRGQIRAPAVLKAPDSVAIFVPTGAELQRQAVTEGQAVRPDDTLFVFDSADIRGRRSLVEARIATLAYQLRAASFDSLFREERPALHDALAAAIAERDSLTHEENRLTIVAGHAGTLVDVLPNLHPGDSVSPRDCLAIVRGNGKPIIDAYVSEVDLTRVHPNDTAIFYPDALSRPPIRAHVASIDRVTTVFLTDWELARSHGGEIAVRGKEGAPSPDGGLYHLRLVPDGDDAVSSQLRGVARIAGERQSLAVRALRAAAAVVMREWGT